MKPISFSGQNLVISKDQPQYAPLPVYRYANDPEGKLVCCWKLSWTERCQLLLTGRLWHTVMTFNQLIQPQMLEVVKPILPPDIHEVQEYVLVSYPPIRGEFVVRVKPDTTLAAVAELARLQMGLPPSDRYSLGALNARNEVAELIMDGRVGDVPAKRFVLIATGTGV